MKRLLVVGFSHLAALGSARKLDGLEVEGIIIHPTERFQPWCSFRDDGTFYYNPAIREEVKVALTQFRPDAIVASLWGNQHFAFSCSNHPRRYDFVLPNDSTFGLDPDAEIIPFDPVLSAFRERCMWTCGIASWLRPLSELPIFMLAAPPPLETLPDGLGMAPKGIADLVHEYGKAPPSLRCKSWQICNRIVHEFSAENGLEFLPPPNGTMQKGFRTEGYVGRDWLHANAAYGEKVLEQVLGALRQ